jgi:heme-degrading monooxygenase HmoA
MYMRMVWARLRRGDWSKYEAAYKNVLRPENQNIKGLRGRWLMRDVKDGDAGYSISLWDSMEAIDRYEKSEYYRRNVIPHLEPFFIGDFTTCHCEVRAMEEFMRI